ncbi:MAG: leucine-rich repeat domain-containing protein [Bacteroidales bacterium]|nr:leucine-rich repeat domain-containing protein [Bacteroidales bacterium]
MKKILLTLFVLLVGAAAWGQKNKDGLVFQSGSLYYKIKGDVVYVTQEVKGTYKGKVEVPSTVTHDGQKYKVVRIDKGAFSYQDELTEVILPNTILAIMGEAFSHCAKLTRIRVPSSVTRIGDAAFAYCPSLTTLEMIADNDKYCTLPGTNAIFEKVGSSYGTVLFAACKNSKLPGSGVHIIGPYAFAGCPLTEIKVPAGYTNLSPSCFQDCKELKSVDLPKSITYVDSDAFRGCSQLTEIRIPKKAEPEGLKGFANSPAKVVRY